LPEAGEEKSPLSHPVFKPVSLPDFQIGDDSSRRSIAFVETLSQNQAILCADCND